MTYGSAFGSSMFSLWAQRHLAYVTILLLVVIGIGKYKRTKHDSLNLCRVLLHHWLLFSFYFIHLLILNDCISIFFFKFMFIGAKKKLRKEAIAAKRRNRMMLRGVDLEQINTVYDLNFFFLTLY